MGHIIEVAKSGRAKCRKCKQSITKGELRFGWETANDFDPDSGMTHKWFHLSCGAAAQPVALAEALASYDGEVPDRGALEAALASGKQKNQPKQYPLAERAPSGRSTCLQCGEKIAKGEWRVAIEREIDTGSFSKTGAGYLHAGCAVEHIGEDDLPEQLASNSGLSATDLAELRAAL